MLDFTVIDTEVKAYLLGLFGADGSITKNNTQVNIGLSGEDKDFIYVIRDLIGSTHKVSYSENIGYMEDPRNGKMYKRSPKCCIQICDKYLADEFIRHGVVPRKSLILEPPLNLPEELRPHYIRGYNDGDGTIVFDGKISDACVYSASKKILEFINDSFLSTYTHSVGISKNRNIWRLHYGYRTAYEFLKFIYRDASIYLPRKYRKYSEIRMYYTNMDTRLKWTEEEVNFLIRHAQSLSYTKLQALLPRWGRDAIISKMKDLGLRKLPCPNSWSDEEINILQELFPTSLQEDVIKALPNRPFKGIQKKAYLLGIKRKHNIGRKGNGK